jgi:hypothetical protein
MVGDLRVDVVCEIVCLAAYATELLGKRVQALDASFVILHGQ